MAEVTTTWTSPWIHIHGAGVANCGNYPDIAAWVTIKFSRTDGGSTVNWEVTDMGWSHPTSGTYGYEFVAYISINDANPSSSNEILSKHNTTGSSWWNAVTTHKPTGSFISTSNVTSVKFYTAGGHCTNGSGGYCYGSSGNCLIDSFTNVAVPSGGYQVTYDGNGGTGVPATQNKQVGVPLVVGAAPSGSPHVNIVYTDTDYTDSQYRSFIEWRGSDNRSYSPGDSYTTDAACTMTAQWQPATFLCRFPTSAAYSLTFSPGTGASVMPAYLQFIRTSGYSATQGSTTVSYIPDQTYTTITDLTLYPVYGSARVGPDQLPIPVREGYGFIGWYKDSALTQPFNPPEEINSNMVLYAKWGKLSGYTIDSNRDWKRKFAYAWICKQDADGNKYWEQSAPLYTVNSSGEWEQLI